jgi:Sec-independent protein translocase protein TatA
MYPLFHFAFLDAMGGSPLELAVVVVAVLVLFGAKSLPGTLRTLGRWSEQLRRISQELQREIMDASEPVNDLKQEWEETTASLRVEQSHSRFAPRPEATENGEERTPEKNGHEG